MTPTRNRRGAVLITIMVFLAVTAAIILSWLKLATIERRQLRVLQAQAQAEWLVESAMSRAKTQLASSPEYRGETWKIAPEDLGGRDGAEVIIHIDTTSEEKPKSISVQADYPADPVRRHRRTKTVALLSQ